MASIKESKKSMKSMSKSTDNTNSLDTKPLKRRRDADQRILDQFWVICDSNTLKREKSLKTIIEILIKQNESNETNDLLYCMDRVVRGLASARQFARHGFCVLLTQLLNVFKHKISIELVYSLAEKHLSKMNELSNHDSVIGWSLVMASLLKSGRLAEEEDEEIWLKSFNVLYTLGVNKQYIELVVCQLIPEFMALLSRKNSLFEKIVLNQIHKDLKTENKFKPFFLYICLYILDNFPEICGKKVDLNFIIKAENLQRLSVLISETTAYQPSVHPLIQLIAKYFINKSENEFSNFWHKCVDETLFTPNQIQKGFLGFEIIKASLPLIKNVEMVSIVLSNSFLRLFIQSLSVNTHSLHNASEQLSEFFISFVKNTSDSELQLEVINSFTKQPGSLLFDDISRSKFFTNLSKNLNCKSIKEWTEKLKTIFLTTNTIDSNDIFRIRCIQQISNTCRSITSTEDIDILWSNIKFLFIHSYFDVKDGVLDEIIKKPLVPISEKLRNTLKDSFRNIFNHLTHLGSKTSKEKLFCEVQALSSMLEFVNQLISNKNIVCLTDSKFLEPFHTIVKRVNRLNKRLKTQSEKQNEIKIFILLFSMFAIQLFEEYEEIENILPDLIECMKRSIDGQIEEADDSSPVWADVLTELLLSVLTTPSKLTKNVLFSCFKHICSHISNIGLQRLIDAISDNQLFAGEHDSDEEEDEEQTEDVDKSESESESEDDNENLEIDEKFRNDVINALGPAAQVDEDEESVYMSDSEMFQIDETLAAVFKTKYTDKKESIEKQKSIVVFRNRCLELIQIFLNNKDINLDQVFQLIQPIVLVAKSLSQTKSNQLSQKSIQLIIQMTKMKDLNNNCLQLNDFKQILDYLMTVLNKTIHSDLQKALNSLSIWTIQMSKKLFANDFWYFDVIENAIKDFFEKNNCQISESFFKTLVCVHSEIGVKFLDVFIGFGFGEDIRPFKKTVSIDLLYTICKINSNKNNENLISKNQFSIIRQNCLKVLCNELSYDKLKGQYVCQLLKLFEFTDKYLTDEDSGQTISANDLQELSAKVKSLSKLKRKKLNNKQLIRKLMSNQ